MKPIVHVLEGVNRSILKLHTYQHQSPDPNVEMVIYNDCQSISSPSTTQ